MFVLLEIYERAMELKSLSSKIQGFLMGKFRYEKHSTRYKMDKWK